MLDAQCDIKTVVLLLSFLPETASEAAGRFISLEMTTIQASFFSLRSTWLTFRLFDYFRYTTAGGGFVVKV